MNGDVALRHLRYFVAVAEELHFGRAARRLHLAQPPLSQQIRKLEEILGVPVFTRTSRAVKLTPAGEMLLERARQMLRKVDEDVDLVRRVGRGELGPLNVGFIGSAMLTGLPETLGRYRRQYPNIVLQLRELYTAGMIGALREGHIDAGFLRDGGVNEGLVVETLLSEPYVVVLPRGHRLARRSTLTAAPLRDEPFVFFSPEYGRRAYDKVVSICEEHGFRPHVVQEAPQWLTIVRLVGAGLGVTIAPACVERIAASVAACRPLRGSRVRSDIELAYRAGEDRSIVTTFCRIARQDLARPSTRR